MKHYLTILLWVFFFLVFLKLSRFRVLKYVIKFIHKYLVFILFSTVSSNFPLFVYMKATEFYVLF